MVRVRMDAMTYLRMTIGRWNIDLNTPEGKEIFSKIQVAGISVFRRQPGFIQYRLMQADARTTIAVAEWESEELGKPGAKNYRDWLKESGIAAKLTLQTLDGEVVASSEL
jgi:hypothetical protein